MTYDYHAMGEDGMDPVTSLHLPPGPILTSIKPRMTEREISLYLARCATVLFLLKDDTPIPRYVYWPWHTEKGPLYQP